MAETFMVKEKLIIKAHAQQVWKALTNPGQVKRYMFGYEVESEWKAGSTILWILKRDGKTYTRKGKVLLAEQNKFLKFTDFNPDVDSEKDESNHAIITYELFENEGSTTLQITDDCAGNEKKYEETKRFWNTVLPKLKEMLET